MTVHEMTDKKRSDDYKQIGGYVPVEMAQEFKSICAREGLSQSEVLKEIIYEWLAQRTTSSPSNPGQANQTTIADLVLANMKKLKRSGVMNLQALARREVLPTPGDFAIITSTLGIPEEEQKMIWQQTFNSGF